MIPFADLFAKGVPPVAGGALDQSAWFVNACRYYWSECDQWRPTPTE